MAGEAAGGVVEETATGGAVAGGRADRGEAGRVNGGTAGGVMEGRLVDEAAA